MKSTQQQIPFRTPFFYGWLILGMCMVSAFLGAGSSQLFMGIMLKPISEDLGWTRTMTAGAITAGTLTGAVLSPIAGKLADKYGPRALVPIGGLMVAIGYFGLANLHTLWQFYAAYIVARSFATVTMGGVIPLTTATNWFHKKRGRALGLVGMSLPLGGSLLAVLSQYIMSIGDWRSVFLVFAAVTAIVVVVPSYVILRRRPEDVGLLPDGDVAKTEDATSGKHDRGGSDEFSFTLSEAMRTRALWLLIASLVLSVLANGAVGFNQVAYYSDVGVAPAAAAFALSAYAMAGAFSSGMWGFLTERFSEQYLAAGVSVLAAMASGMLLTVNGDFMAIAASIFYGMAARGEGPLLNMIIARYFGRNSYGAISGFTSPFQMVSLGFGPLIGSLTYDLTGSYRGAFIVFVFIYLVTAGLLILARPPKRPVRVPAQPQETARLSG